MPDDGLPEKVTLGWLRQHMPLSAWIGLGAAILAVFTLGAKLSHTTFVSEMLGISNSADARAAQDKADKLSQRLDGMLQQARADKEQAEKEKTGLQKQIQELRGAIAKGTETEADNTHLRDLLSSVRAQAAASDKRATQLESDLRSIKEKLAENAGAPNQTASVPPTPPSVPAESVTPPPAKQRLEFFTVEVSGVQLSRNGRAIAYVRVLNTARGRIKMLLAGGFLGENKTSMIDDMGQEYRLENASGIGTCCFGLAGGDWQGAIVDLSPNGNTEVTLTFSRHGRDGDVIPERQPQTFRLTSELTLGDAVMVQGWHERQWRSTGSASINVSGIRAR